MTSIQVYEGDGEMPVEPSPDPTKSLGFGADQVASAWYWGLRAREIHQRVKGYQWDTESEQHMAQLRHIVALGAKAAVNQVGKNDTEREERTRVLNLINGYGETWQEIVIECEKELIARPRRLKLRLCFALLTASLVVHRALAHDSYGVGVCAAITVGTLLFIWVDRR
jgi:hypothetical protein